MYPLISLAVSFALDCGLLFILREYFPIGLAQYVSFTVAAPVLFLTLSFPYLRSVPWGTIAAFALWFVLLAMLRALILGVYQSSWPEARAAALLAVAATGVPILAVVIRPLISAGIYAWQSPGRWLSIQALALTGYLIVFRSLGAALLPLIAQEAYYWKYAENLAPSYLDHPPAVAVLIALGTGSFGDTELGARVGAVLMWFGAAYFLVKLATELFGPLAARGTILLLSVLPFFSAAGVFISPDSPLLFFWAGAVFFLYRALLRNQERAWYGAGIFIGLGFLSKYTIVVLIPAIFLFLVLDRYSRKWLLRAEPYVGALAGLLLTYPVFYWNAQHEWISFVFQSIRRLHAEGGFYVHRLIIDWVVLLTPPGVFVWLASSLSPRFRLKLGLGEEWATNLRVERFIHVFAGVPLGLFFLLSFGQELKINWTAPAFIPLLPFLARSLWEPDVNLTTTVRWVQRGWLVCLLALIAGVSVCGTYLTVGIPGVPYTEKLRKFLGWEELALVIRDKEKKFAARSGTAPLVVGLDSHYVGSELGFYRAKLAQRSGERKPERTQGRSLFGCYSLMFHFWSDPETHRGRDMIVVSRTRRNLESPAVEERFLALDPVEELPIRRKGQLVARYYSRLGRGYTPRGDESSGLAKGRAADCQ